MDDQGKDLVESLFLMIQELVFRKVDYEYFKIHYMDIFKEFTGKEISEIQEKFLFECFEKEDKIRGR